MEYAFITECSDKILTLREPTFWDKVVFIMGKIWSIYTILDSLLQRGSTDDAIYIWTVLLLLFC